MAGLEVCVPKETIMIVANTVTSTGGQQGESRPSTRAAKAEKTTATRLTLDLWLLRTRVHTRFISN